MLAAMIMVCLSGSALFAAPKPEASIKFCANNHCNKDTFPILGVDQIDMLTVWRNLSPGDHVQDLKLILPNGDVYQVLHTAFTTSPSNTHGRVRALATEGGHALDTVLPVRGTWIQQFSMTGTWSVQMLLDGNQVQTAKFTFTATSHKTETHD